MERIAILLLALCLLQACQKNNTLIIKEEPNDLNEFINMNKYLGMEFDVSYQVKLPEYLKAVGMANPDISDAKATIGRVLFYDKNLSADQTVSCASCHKQANAFSDNKAFSLGIDKQASTRNAPPIGNVANFAAHYSLIRGAQPLLLWDERASTVGQLARMAINNPHEMNMSMEQVVDRVKLQEYYPYLWRQAYGDVDITEDRVLECLSQFVGAISNYNSTFDQALEKTSGLLSVTDTIVRHVYYGDDPNDTTIITGLPFLSQSAFRGLKIFVDNCSKCHSPIRPFQEVFMACNGLDLNYTDQGLGAITGHPSDNGVFKAPCLRNIALTAPYMHDGRFKTLDEVVEFYSTGVQEHPNLHPDMRNTDGSVKKNFDAYQKADLIAFLHTLTDNSAVNDFRFANPFK